jgi:hypothetical protein
MADPALETIKDLQRFEAMFDTLDQWLEEGFIHIGLAARQGSNNVMEPFREATRMMNAYAYDTLALAELGVKMGRIPVMEDFDLTLQLLRKGYPNRVSYQYVWNQRGSGKKESCSVSNCRDAITGCFQTKGISSRICVSYKQDSRFSLEGYGRKRRRNRAVAEGI